METRELREELAQRAEELRKGDQLFIERDRELAEVRSQLAELQTLFGEVSHQFQAKQGTRSHPSQARGAPPDVDRCATHERGERIRTARILKKDQQHTVLLLDVM